MGIGRALPGLRLCGDRAGGVVSSTVGIGPSVTINGAETEKPCSIEMDMARRCRVRRSGQISVTKFGNARCSEHADRECTLR
jgi:hypothetical protein